MRLPDFEFTRLEGGKVKVSDLRGNPAVINFWATWCGPCKEEIPLLQEAYSSNSHASFQLIAVTEESKGEVSSFIETNGMSLPVVLDPGGQASQRYHIQGIPTTFFLDSTGVVIIRHMGTLTSGSLQVFLEQIMAKEERPINQPTPTVPTSTPVLPDRTPAPHTDDDLVGGQKIDRS
ncbi:MAG: TlpA family protein disulfide reductase [Oscillochloris sp.]|nr:TlpA family protein disulfide reductase [Oscillochloris sp.]